MVGVCPKGTRASILATCCPDKKQFQEGKDLPRCLTMYFIVVGKAWWHGLAVADHIMAKVRKEGKGLAIEQIAVSLS